jgi:hypothetical protein
MAFKRIVAKSEEDLKTIMSDIIEWFKKTDQYVKKEFSTEKRRIQDPDTKIIDEKNIDVIKVQEPLKDKNGKIVDYKKATIKFIPMIKKGEMKVEISGEGEATIADKISNQMKGKGVLKSYSKDKKVALKESNTIKKSELTQLIKEEIKNLLNENDSITIEGISSTGKGYTVWKGNNPIGDLRQKIGKYSKNDFGEINVGGKEFDFYFVTQIKTDKLPYIKSLKDHVNRPAYFTVSAPKGSVSKEKLKAAAEDILEKNKNQNGIIKF